MMIDASKQLHIVEFRQFNGRGLQLPFHLVLSDRGENVLEVLGAKVPSGWEAVITAETYLDNAIDSAVKRVGEYEVIAESYFLTGFDDSDQDFIELAILQRLGLIPNIA